MWAAPWAALRQLLVAVGLFGARAAAFRQGLGHSRGPAPGRWVPRRHVQLRPPAATAGGQSMRTDYPLQRRSGVAMPDLRYDYPLQNRPGLAILPVLRQRKNTQPATTAAPLEAAPPRKEYNDPDPPILVPLSAMEVLTAWASFSADLLGMSLENYLDVDLDEARARPSDAHVYRSQMFEARRDIYYEVPTYIFALAANRSVDSIAAIAMVVVREMWFEFGQTFKPVIHITRALASPGSYWQRGAKDELIHQIIEHYKTSDRMFIMTPGRKSDEAYYETRGFRLSSLNSETPPGLIYTGFDSGERLFIDDEGEEDGDGVIDSMKRTIFGDVYSMIRLTM